MIHETISAIAILGIAVLFLSPGHLTMPESIQSMLIIGLIISYLTFAAYLFREKSSDERESMHVLTAGRISYLVGVGTLILGLILQALRHEIDSWLVIALCAMVFSKLLSRIYSHFRM
ncbi:MAG: energy-coupling factor ABC transporter permease [Candidatus Roizmanbacteria bacterium]